MFKLRFSGVDISAWVSAAISDLNAPISFHCAPGTRQGGIWLYSKNKGRWNRIERWDLRRKIEDHMFWLSLLRDEQPLASSFLLRKEDNAMQGALGRIRWGASRGSGLAYRSYKSVVPT